MICPRCSFDQVPEIAERCPRCSCPLTGDAPAPQPVSEELERVLRRDLGDYYQIQELLGRGGMSLVYLAFEAELSRLVALKVLPLQFIHDADSARRFEREAKIAAALDHPHIVPIHRVGATGTFLWYAMKYVQGRSLAQIIETGGALPLEETLRIVEQVGSALYYAHRHGVVHRDVKPANVLIDPSGWALVCDFGVARAFGNVALTRTGASLGTPRYMAPEQFEGKAVDGRCDQYSLAILAYEALTATPPFGGDSIGELIRKHLLEPPPRLVDVRPDLPAHVSQALERAMRKKPEDRFTDVAEFVEALGGKPLPQAPAAFATPGARRPPPVLVPGEPVPAASPARPTRRRAATWAAAAVVVAAGAAWAALQVRSAPPEPTGAASRESSGIALDSFPAVAETLDSEPRARPPAREGTPATLTPGKLVISSLPVGQLYVDGRLIGSTPRPNVPLAPGRRRLRIAQDGFLPWDTTITVAPGGEVRLTGITLKPRS